MRLFPVTRGHALWVAATVAAVGMFCGPAHAQKDEGVVLAVQPGMMVFPFDVTGVSATNTADVSSAMTDVAVSRAVLSRAYQVTQFYKNYPPVSRAVAEQQLTSTDSVAPFSEDNRKASKIMRVVGFDYVLVGGVAEYQYDETSHTVTTTVSGRVLQSTKDAVGYKIVKSAMGTGSATKAGATEEELAVDACRAATDKLMTDLVPKAAVTTMEPTTAPAVEPKKKHAKRRLDWLWGSLAVGLGLGIALFTVPGCERKERLA